MKFIEIFEDELPMDTASRMQRAKELGFTIPAYHGTNMKFDEFDLEKGTPHRGTGYAPNFANKKAEAAGYAKKRKENGGKANVLHVLLRVKNPFNINYFNPISKEEYTKIVGHPAKDKFSLTSGNAMYDAREQILNKLGLGKPPGTGDNFNQKEWDIYLAKDPKTISKIFWTEMYKRLISLGYDSMVDPKTPGDNSSGFYTKYVVFDPKNVRSINARFDPAKSDSRNLMD